ncbi:MAG: type II secretion system protein [Sulfuricurvum sp.]|jgi:hypothetical protein|uniref:type II secretion system protein n=1 Tax=Sulfuricurvum sp. TaxID=2025608 RepID=UPI003561CEEE
MQRENNIIKRKGMALLMAIFLLIIIGSIMAVSLSMSGTTVARTTNDYLHEQALLLSSSATEYAVLAISGRDKNNTLPVINAIYPNAVNPMFDVTMNIRYIGDCPRCANYYIDNLTSTPTHEANTTVMIDVDVSSNPALNLNEPIRYHRRTLQKL